MSQSRRFPRLAFLIIFFILFWVPWLDVIVGHVVANFYKQRFDTLPPTPIAVPGFLLVEEKDYDYPAIEGYLEPPNGYRYVEIEYTGLTRHTPGELHGPGFYRFAPIPRGEMKCPGRGTRGNPDGMIGVSEQCFRYTRSDRPLSRYAYGIDPAEYIFPTVTALCTWVKDLQHSVDVARTCSFIVFTWYGWQFGGVSSAPQFRQVQDILRPEVFSVTTTK